MVSIKQAIFLLFTPFLLTSFTPDSTPPQELTFQELVDLEEDSDSPQELLKALNSYDEKLVAIRGFVYKLKDGRWVLSCDPDVPSCCEKGTVLCRRIFLEGNVDDSYNHRLAYVSGILIVDYNRSVKDSVLKMQNPSLAAIEGFKISHILLIGGVLMIIMILLKRRAR